jgi:hypothetical protein
MTTPIPSIPMQLAGRPTIGGLVVPWTTGRTPDGRYRFGAVDLDRHNRAMNNQLCQTCGAALEQTCDAVREDRIVFAMRDSDLRALTSHEPGMHPVCAAYAATACPMLKPRQFTNTGGQLAREPEPKCCIAAIVHTWVQELAGICSLSSRMCEGGSVIPADSLVDAHRADVLHGAGYLPMLLGTP